MIKEREKTKEEMKEFRDKHKEKIEPIKRKYENDSRRN